MSFTGYTLDIELKNEIILYVTAARIVPFAQWLESLDKPIRARIKERLKRVALGNMGDCAAIAGGEGICELRFFFGPGYRVYYAMVEENIVLLLSGGEKSTQSVDIKKASIYFRDYLQRGHDE